MVVGGAAPSLLGRIGHDQAAHCMCLVSGSALSLVSIVAGVGGVSVLISLPRCHPGAGGGGKSSAAIECGAAEEVRRICDGG